MVNELGDVGERRRSIIIILTACLLKKRFIKYLFNFFNLCLVCSNMSGPTN